MKTSRLTTRLVTALGILSLGLFSPVQAAVTPGGTLGDSASFSADPAAPNLDTTLANGAGLSLDGPSVAHIFDTEADGTVGATDGTYELNPTGTDGTEIAVSSGRHLLFYNTQFNDDSPANGPNRLEIQSYLELGGTPLAIGRSQGFTRDAGGADEAVLTGAAIIDSPADDTILKLLSFRSDANDLMGCQRENAALQLLKIDDSWDFLSLEQSVNGASVGGAGVNVSYDTVTANTGSAFSFTSGTSDITLNQTGLYLVCANTSLEKDVINATRTSYTQRLTIGGGTVPGTSTTTYVRADPNDAVPANPADIDCQSGVTSIGTIIDVTVPGSTLNVNVFQQAGGQPATIQGGETAITIVKLPVSAEIIKLSRTTTQNSNVGITAGVNPPIWDTTLNSSGAFTHPGTIAGTTSAIEVNADGEYLFLSTFFNDSNDGTNDNGDRVVVQHGFGISFGGEERFGQGAEYNRDNGGNNTAGSFSGAVFDLLATDEVELLLTPIGNTAEDTQTVDMTITGLRLGSIFPSNDPAIVTNSVVALTVGESAAIDDTILFASDLDTADGDLTYSVDSLPTGGTLFINAVAVTSTGTTFTQADLVAGNVVSYTAGGSELDPDTINFTVADNDGGPTASGTLTIRVIQAIVVTADTGSTDEDTVASVVVSGSSLLDNDTGNSITVTSFDAASVQGATVNVNADGTFTYDPTGSATLQALGFGDNLGDSFTYTVTDAIGKTDTATVSFSVDGIEDAIGAVADVLDGPLEDAVLNSTANLVANDGPLGTNLRLNYDGRSAPIDGNWPNLGSAGSGYDHALTGVTHDNAVTSSRAQITGAYEWDSTLDRAVFANGLAIHNLDTPVNVDGNADRTDATLEFWLKPGVGWDTTVMTIFETGGGGGVGMIIDQGVLIAATEFDGPTLAGSTVTYDLDADPLGLIGGDPSTEFNQYVLVIRPNDRGLSLYINSVLVDNSPDGTAADFDGGDAWGLGRFNAANHGGFVGGAAGTRYDAPFIGQMAIVRFYGDDIGQGGVLLNYNAVNGNTDTEGDTISITGLFDGTTVVGLSTPVTLPSGALVAITSASGDFSYLPNGAFDSLVAGETAQDTFTYQVTDSGSDGTAQEQNASATVTLTIHGTNQSADDVLTVLEGTSVTFPASAIVGNDQHGIGTAGPFINLDTRAVGTPWLNTGSGGARYDVVAVGQTLKSAVVDGNSNFGALGDVWEELDGSTEDITTIDTDDSTYEVWFKPVAGATKQVIFETGGGGTGSSLVWNGTTNQVVFRADNGDPENTTNQLVISAGGVSFDEFNQVVIVYDKNNPTVEDTVAMYLNNDPSAAFNSIPVAVAVNPVGGVNEISGTDNMGFGETNGAIAADETNVLPFEGQIAIFRAYDRILSPSELAENYEDVVQGITSLGGSPIGGVTLNPDGSVTYDATALSIASDQVDAFTYTISDGEGGFTTSTVTVNVLNQGAVIATSDDTAMILEGDMATSFSPLANDLGAGLSILLQEGFANNNGVEVITQVTGGALAHGTPGDFSSTTGWRFLWNAPDGWVDGTAEDTTLTWSGSTGPLDSVADWDLLVWDSTVNGFLVDADGVGGPDLDSEPGAYLRISPGGGGHSGYGSTQAGSVGNTLDRYVILEWDVTVTGFYGIANSSLTKTSANGNELEVAAVIDGVVQTLTLVPPATTVDFDGELGQISAGSKLAIAVGPANSRASDSFTGLNFDIVRLPSAQATVNDTNGLFSVSADGKRIIYDPNGAFEFLDDGQTTTETITYTVTDGADVSTANFTVTITGENDAPTAIADAYTTDENTVLAGNVFDNDSDPDQGDFATISVIEVDGVPGAVGVPSATLGGGTVTLNADGTFTYDPAPAYEFLNPEESDNDFFTYLMQDSDGAQANTVTVTLTITGNEDGVIASDNSYSYGNADGTVMGNLILDDTGSGVDMSIDISDSLSILTGDFSTTLGTFEVALPQQIGVFGTETAVTDAGTVVNYGGGFTNPVFIFGPPSDNDTEPSIVQFEVINATSFALSIKEQPEGGVFSDGDGATHPAETVSWAVIEAGTYQLPNGALMEVGTISTSAIRQSGGPNSWQAVNFTTLFNTPPAVITSLQTFDSDLAGADAELFGTRINSNSITTTGFSVALEDVQALDPDGAGPLTAQSGPRTQPETIGYVAIEAGSGGIVGTPFEVGNTGQVVGDEHVTINFARDVGAAPAFFAQLASYFGVDPAQGRFRNLDSDSVQVRSAEDTFGDDEGDPGIGDPPAGVPEFSEGHAAEVFSYVVIGGGSGPILAYEQGEFGKFTFTPDPGKTGTDTLSYTLTDGRGNTDTGVITLTTTADVDSDGDGIPDSYENANGLNPNDPSDADTDPDVDGTTALQEYLFGTLENNKASVFTIRITDVNVGAGTVEITYGPVVAGLEYELNGSTTGYDLWSLVEPRFVPGTDSPNGDDGTDRVVTKAGVVNPGGEVFYVEAFGNELTP